MNWGGVFAIARHSIRQSFTARLSIGWLVVFFLLSANLPILFGLASHLLPPDYTGTNLPNFITESLAFLPLLALGLGSTAITEERESGTLQYILSHPISTTDFFVGRWLGLAVATSLMVSLGYGAASVFVYGLNLAPYYAVLEIIAIGIGLNISMLGLALVLSTLANRKMTALATAVFLWILMSYLTQIGLIDAANYFQNGGVFVLILILINPIETASLLAALTGGSGYSNLGIAGQFIKETIGDSLGSLVGTALAIDLLLSSVALFSLGLVLFTREEGFSGWHLPFNFSSSKFLKKTGALIFIIFVVVGIYYVSGGIQNGNTQYPATVGVSGTVNPTGFAGIPLDIYFDSPGHSEVSSSVAPGGHFQLTLVNRLVYNVTLLYRDLNYNTYYCSLGDFYLDTKANTATFNANC